MPNLLLAYDFGTSGVKAALFKDDGTLIKSRTVSYPTRYLNDNWAEQDPVDWIRALKEANEYLLNAEMLSDIAVISFSGYMGGCVYVDSGGVPLYPGLLWSDRRATAQFEKLLPQIDDETHLRYTLRKPTAVRQMEKTIWMKENREEIYDKTYKVLEIAGYIAYLLTGNYVTDYPNASITGLFDSVNKKWLPALFSEAGLAMSKFPEAVPSDTVIGYVTKQAAVEYGLMQGIPVVIGAGDGAAAGVGTGCVEHKDMHFSIGSSAWCSISSKEPLLDLEKKRTYSCIHAVPDLYLSFCTIMGGGTSYKWLKDEICLHENYEAEMLGKDGYDLINRQIEESRPGSNGLFFLPFLRGDMCIRQNLKASGAYVGIRADTKHADLIRSVGEGISYYLCLAKNVFTDVVGNIDSVVLVGGTARSREWCKVFCDVIGTKIRVPVFQEEAASVGAAIIGGVGVGLFSDYSVAKKFFRIQYERYPDQDLHKEYLKRMKVFQAICDAISPVYEDVFALSTV